MSRSRTAVAAFFAFTGTMHFLRPRFFEAIVPPEIEARKKEIVAVSPEQIKGLDLRKVPRWALWARLPLQPLAMLWVWRATRS